MTVVLGYQRPRRIATELLQLWDTGSKMLTLGRPWSILMWPPAANTRPSGRRVRPEQKSSAGSGVSVNIPVAGSQTWGFPVSPQESTLPLGRTATSSPTMGQLNGALQVPAASGLPVPATSNEAPDPQGVRPLLRRATRSPSLYSSTTPASVVTSSVSLYPGSPWYPGSRVSSPVSSVPATR